MPVVLPPVPSSSPSFSLPPPLSPQGELEGNSHFFNRRTDHEFERALEADLALHRFVAAQTRQQEAQKAAQMALYNPYLPEPQLQSTMQRANAQQASNLLPNGWEPLVIPSSPKPVIPGVSTNAVGKNYRVSHKIGMGSFGEIFLGIDIRTNERIAIKVENRTTKYPQLLDEYAVYRAVAKGIGVPTAIWCGSNTNVHIMVMDLLGDSLETLYNTCGRKFSLKTITMLAIQLLHRIEHHHNHHYLHRVRTQDEGEKRGGAERERG